MSENKDCEKCTKKSGGDSGCLGLVCGFMLLGFAIESHSVIAIVLAIFLILDCL